MSESNQAAIRVGSHALVAVGTIAVEYSIACFEFELESHLSWPLTHRNADDECC